MLLAQIQSSYKRMPTNLEAVTTSPNHATNDGVNEDKTIASERSKIVEFKNMIRSNNEQIKIVPFEAHLKVGTSTNLMISSTTHLVWVFFYQYMTTQWATGWELNDTLIIMGSSHPLVISFGHARLSPPV